MYEHRHDNIAGICNQKIDFEPTNVTTSAQIPNYVGCPRIGVFRE